MTLWWLVPVTPVVAWLSVSVLGLRLAPASAWLALWVLAIAPLLEETVFRHLLQQGMAQRLRDWCPGLGGPRDAAGHWASVLASVAFAASHAPQAGWMAMWWLVPSLALGELWRRQQRLWPCVALHAWFNLCLLGATLAARG